jgi:hypothetical protein
MAKRLEKGATEGSDEQNKPAAQVNEPVETEFDSEVLEEPLNELEKALAEFPSEHISAGNLSRDFSDEEVDAVVSATALTYGIGKKAANVAIAEMIRRGGHAVSVPPSFNIEIYCPEVQSMTVIYKRDILRFIELHTKGRKTFKNLANSLGRSIVRMGIYRLDKYPGSDWPGDLARKIDTRLAVKKEPSLSPSERVGCASYAQNIPELDALCQSTRLKHLLAEDLDSRRKGQSQNKPKGQQAQESKVKKGGGQKGQSKKK